MYGGKWICNVRLKKKKKRWKNMERMHKVKQKDGEIGVMGILDGYTV